MWKETKKITLQGKAVVTTDEHGEESETFSTEEEARAAFIALFKEIDADPSLRCEFTAQDELTVLEREAEAAEEV